MSSKRHYTPESFETGQSYKIPYATIHRDLFYSKAFRSLTPKQRDLYVAMKLEYYGNNSPLGKKDLFYFNKGIYSKLSYSDNAFYRDRDNLILKGFIKVYQQGEHSKTIYQYSNKWKKYGESDYSITPDEMSTSLLHKLNKYGSLSFYD